MSPSSPGADRDLLLGVFALQLGFVGRDHLMSALGAWAGRKTASLGAVLRERGLLEAPVVTLLAGLVEQHLGRHGSARASLSTIVLSPEARRQLAALDDADILASLPPPTVETPAEGSPTEGPPTLLPPPVADHRAAAALAPRFRRLGLHARGGLGEVYLARDSELDREVALKEIQDRYADHPGGRSRFLREALITGALEHPGIVPVYGLGSYPDGRPFYAMRLIRGKSLQEAVRELHERPAPASADQQLLLRALLTRFVTVCYAVAYAHSRGVIHRDLKPDNIMLGDFGETLVVDWGLARVHAELGPEGGGPVPPVRLSGENDSTPTEMGQAVGTPAFMPPEQARGQWDQVGPATDVFALGATLYAVLTGRPPYVGPNTLQLAEKATFPAPRLVGRETPAALEAVCLKAMAESPADRYGSARELAEEVERFLADEPVRARREPLPERLRRWARRHRTAVSSLGMLLVASVLALAMGLWAVGREQGRTRQALRQADDNLNRAEGAAAAARANLARAEGNLKLARAVVDEYFLVARDSPHLQQEHVKPVRKLLFEKALPFYQGFQARRTDEAVWRRERAEEVFRVAFIFNETGRKSDALAAYDQALTLGRELIAAEPLAADHRGELARTHYNRAALLIDLDRPRDALTDYQEARRLQAKLFAEAPLHPLHLTDLAGTCHNLGLLHLALGRRAEAVEALSQARSYQQRLLERSPVDGPARAELARTTFNLGLVLAETGQRPKALAALQEALKLQRELAKERPDLSQHQVSLAATHNSIGLLLRDMGRREAALEALQAAANVLRRQTKDYPEVRPYRADLAGALLDVAGLLLELAEAEESARTAGEAIEILTRLRQDQPDSGSPSLQSAYQLRARALREKGRYAEALADWARALELAPGPRRPYLRLQRAATHGLSWARQVQDWARERAGPE